MLIVLDECSVGKQLKVEPCYGNACFWKYSNIDEFVEGACVTNNVEIVLRLSLTFQTQMNKRFDVSSSNESQFVFSEPSNFKFSIQFWCKSYDCNNHETGESVKSAAYQHYRLWVRKINISDAQTTKFTSELTSNTKTMFSHRFEDSTVENDVTEVIDKKKITTERSVSSTDTSATRTSVTETILFQTITIDEKATDPFQEDDYELEIRDFENLGVTLNNASIVIIIISIICSFAMKCLLSTA